MPTTDDLRTDGARQKALRKHQEKGSPYEAMDCVPDYVGATWAVVGNSIQILLDPNKCAGRRRVIVVCPDLGQECQCNLHEEGACEGHDSYTKSRVLLSDEEGITGSIAVCDACRPYWLVARDQAAHDRETARAERRARMAARGRRREVVAAESQQLVANDGDVAVADSGQDDLAAVLADLASLGVASAKRAGLVGEARDDVA
jgi:hypothetical protein